jgi:hypothetical protein
MIAAALLALALSAPPPQSAAPLPVAQADARCLAAFSILANRQGTEVQRAAQLGALFFYGKLRGRDPGGDLKTLLTQAATAVGANGEAELRRCGEELRTAGEAMQTVGSAMTAPTPAPTPKR